MPTFAFHGLTDTYTDPKGSERPHAGIAPRDKELWLVPDGRHGLPDDLPRDEVLARMLAWLGGEGRIGLQRRLRSLS